MAAEKRVKVWDLPLRLFHWLLVAAVAVAFLSSEENSPVNQWHVPAGWVAGILIIFRLMWGFVGGEHSRFSDFLRPGQILDHLSGLAKGRVEPSLGHNPLGAAAVLLMLFLIAVTVWTGAFGGQSTEQLHEIVGWTLLAMVGVHILAVLIMSVLQGENLVSSMIRGTKPARRHLSARDARAPGMPALLLAVTVVVAALYAVLRYDPQAFTLRPTKAVEHRGSA
jgi:cytochrome b